MGGTPVNKSAGKATKLPPPATALIPPPRAPAKNRKMALCRFKRKFYHECGWSSKERAPRSSGAECILEAGRLLIAPICDKSLLDNAGRPVYERGHSCALPPLKTWLAPQRRVTGGIQREGKETFGEVCRPASLQSDRSAPHCCKG